MADLFTVTAPLVIRFPDNENHYVVALFKHPKGLLCFKPYWHQLAPDEAGQTGLN